VSDAWLKRSCICYCYHHPQVAMAAVREIDKRGVHLPRGDDRREVVDGVPEEHSLGQTVIEARTFVRTMPDDHRSPEAGKALRTGSVRTIRLLAGETSGRGEPEPVKLCMVRQDAHNVCLESQWCNLGWTSVFCSPWRHCCLLVLSEGIRACTYHNGRTSVSSCLVAACKGHSQAARYWASTGRS
jgi:hypothetical protein